MVERAEVIARLRANLELLRDSDPEGWPETLARLVGEVARMDVWTMDLFCDATTQIAATAHQQAVKRWMN